MNDQVAQIKKLIEPHAEFAFLMGSFGTPRFNDQSDLDLAVYFSNKVDWNWRAKLSSQLMDIVGRDVDLVDLRDTDPIFARQVLETGRLLFCKDSGLLVSWKATQMSKYIDLKMGRAEIEKQLLTRKKFNG
jgi:predicted nucleotidyltransferase